MKEAKGPPIELPPGATMADYQGYIRELETLHGWLDVDLVHNCFLMGEEVGELFKAVRKWERYFDEGKRDAAGSEGRAGAHDHAAAKEHVGEEIVDVMNYLLAIANRLDIDVEAAFRRKNAENQARSWGPPRDS